MNGRSWNPTAVLLLIMLNSWSMAAILSKNINLLVGERLEDVLEDVHFVVKRFHLQVTHDDAREILAELVRIYLCQFGSASKRGPAFPSRG